MSQIRVRKSYEQEGFRQPVFQYRPDWPYVSVGFGSERDYFVENLSLLISSGMGISASLAALSASAKSRKMKKIVAAIEAMVTAGSPLWRAFEATSLLPERIISLIKSGEEAGKLPEHLNLVTVQQHKEKVFVSRLRSALLYPGIVLTLAVCVSIASAWVVLPKLTAIFNESKGTLPLATRVLLGTGDFFSRYGSVAVPVGIVVTLAAAYLIFFYRKTKFIGDAILLSIPGINELVRGVELARFGYIFGVLLQAGFQVDGALDAVSKGTTYRSYRKFYEHLRERMLQGDSMRSAFAAYPKVDRYIPIPIQQLVVSAEKSGRLPETFIKVGVIFEEKTEAMSRDVATVLEPIVLIVVGLIVGFVVMAIIGPIYGLSSQIS